MEFSPLLLVKQHFPDRALKDIPGEVRKQLESAAFGANLKPVRVWPSALEAGASTTSPSSSRLSSITGKRRERGLSSFQQWGVTEPLRRKDKPTCSRITGSMSSRWAARSLASWKLSPSEAAEGIEAFMDRMAFESDGVMLS